MCCTSLCLVHYCSGGEINDPISLNEFNKNNPAEKKTNAYRNLTMVFQQQRDKGTNWRPSIALDHDDAQLFWLCSPAHMISWRTPHVSSNGIWDDSCCAHNVLWYRSHIGTWFTVNRACYTHDMNKYTATIIVQQYMVGAILSVVCFIMIS